MDDFMLILRLLLTNASNTSHEPSTDDLLSAASRYYREAYQSEHQTNWNQLMALTVMLGFLGVIGFAANLTVLAVLAFEGPRKLVHRLIGLLAAVDCLLAAVGIPGTLVELWTHPHEIEAFCRGMEMLRAAGIFISVVLLVAIATERLLLALPRRSSKNHHRVLLSVLAVLVTLSLVVGAVAGMQLSVYQEWRGRPFYLGVCIPKQNSQQNLNPSQILRITYTSIFAIGFVILLVIYFLVFYNIYKTRGTMRSAAHRAIARCTIEQSSLERRETFELSESNVYVQRRQFFDRFDSMPDSTESQPKPIYDESDPIMQREQNCEQVKKSSLRINTEKNHLLLHRWRNLLPVFSTALLSLFFFLSYLPWCLIINNVIHYNMFLFYLFFLNSTTNPFVYCLMNITFLRNAKNFWYRIRCSRVNVQNSISYVSQ